MRAGAHLTAHRDGSVLPIFALALVPLLGLVGAVVDYSRASNMRTALQAMLDASLLAGARDGSTNWAGVAANYFQANVRMKGGVVATPVFQLDKNRAYTASVSATVPTDFMGLVGVQSINVNVSSAATVTASTGNYYCVMALNQSAQAALSLNGNASIVVTAPKCVVQVNSNNQDAVDMTGNATITSVENCFVGGLRTAGNASITPQPDALCKAVPDPFASYPRPTVGPCDFTNYAVSGNKTVIMQPGVYCGGMNFSGAVNVTFEPGVYVVKDGVISESGGSFNGTGVAFFLTGLGASMQLSGQANWHIIAPTSGALAGFAIFLDPSGPTGLAASSSMLSGQSELYFEGIVYFPQQQVSVTGTAVAFAPSPYTSYIGDTLKFVGSGELVINNNTNLTAVPIPTALMVQTGGKLVLTH
jgi:Flp pilus assembly protein TadG